MRTALFLSIALLTVSHLSAEVVETKIVPTESQIAWTGKKVTGQHTGTVAIKSGTVELDGKKVVGGKFEIDMNTVTVTDITDPKDNAKLVGHLKSEDFFKVAQFPNVTFTITKAEPITNAAAGAANYNITGDLVILGVSQPVTFPAQINVGADKSTAKAVLSLDRTQWNLRYGSGKFFKSLGDKIIYDNFDVELNVTALG